VRIGVGGAVGICVCAFGFWLVWMRLGAHHPITEVVGPAACVLGGLLLGFAVFGSVWFKVAVWVEQRLKEYGSRRIGWAAVVGMFSIYVVVFSTFAILRHDQFNSSAYDLAIQDQVLWNTFRGHFMETSIEVPRGEFQSYLGDHFSLTHLALVPLYGIWADVRVLLIAQTVLLALGAFPVFGLARRRLGVAWGVVFAAAYLAYPAVGFVNRFDFHPVSLCVPILLAALWLADRGRLARASVFLALAMLCKEQIGLVVSAYGLAVLAFGRHRRLGALWLAVGLPVSLVALCVVIPHFRGTASGTLSRYERFGGGPAGMAAFLLKHPAEPLEEVFARYPFKATYVGKVLLPLGFASLLAPEWLVPTLPVFLYNLLSNNPSQSSIYFQYVCPIIPFAFFAAIVGVGRARLRNGRALLARLFPNVELPRCLSLALAGPCLLAFTALAQWLDCPLTKRVGVPYHEVYGIERHVDARVCRGAVSLIPDGVSVDATMAFAPHLSHRRDLRLVWPLLGWGVVGSDFVVAHLTDARWNQYPDPAGPRRFLLRELAEAVAKKGYGVRYFEGDVVVLQKGRPLDAKSDRFMKRVMELTRAIDASRCPGPHLARMVAPP